MREWWVLLPLLAFSCRGTISDSRATPAMGDSSGVPCTNDTNCATGQWCLHDRCTPKPADPSSPTATTVQLKAVPGTLDFGHVEPASTKQLALSLENIGEAIATVKAVEISPANTPFSVSPMGYGPFWIRPERSRELFVICRPPTGLASQATLTIRSEGPPVSVQLVSH